VRFQDSDPFDHLNNAKYLEYFMNAREDHLLEYYGLNAYKIAKTEGAAWVVVSNQISYFRPALTMENIIMESQLIGFKDKHLFVEVRMYDEKRSHLKSFVWIHLVHFDLRTQKSVSHKPSLKELLEGVVLPVEGGIFEERVKVLQKDGLL
jgi:thioesterase III